MGFQGTPIVLAITIGTILIYSVVRSKGRKLPAGTRLPPGPPGSPIVGNLLEIPPQHSWLKFKEFTDKYGPIVRLSIAGQEHLILGTEKIANDLLRERGNIYSDRHQLPAAQQLLNGHKGFLLMPYGSTWRKMRKFLHLRLNSNMAPNYHSQQHLEGIRLLRDIIRDPSNYEELLERFSAGVAIRVIYGQRIEKGSDSRAQNILWCVHEFERVASPGAYLVDVFPWMMHVPEALAGFKRQLLANHRRTDDFFESMVQKTQQVLADKGQSAGVSFASEWLADKEKTELDDKTMVWTLGHTFEAAAGTTAAATMSFILIMTREPQWFPKLQEELDRVVGDERLPNLDDVPDLPTVRAFVKETLRYYPVTAGGVPHLLTQDDVYEGYFIKAGTMVHGCQWIEHRDPALYPEPETFNPNRWLEPSYPTYKEPLSLYPNLKEFSAFGHGRRICPGINVAEKSLYLEVALLAWGCNIGRAKDEAGNEIIPPWYDFVEGFNVQPKTFPFTLTARSTKKVERIEQSYQQSLNEDPLLDKSET